MAKKKVVDTDNAAKFINSERGMYIIAQALFEAIKTLKKVPAPFTEVSNISDMEFLLDNLFPHYKAVLEGMQLMQSTERKRIYK